MYMKRLLFIISIVLAITLLFGCTPKIKTKDGGSIAFGKDGIEVETEDGEKATISEKDGDYEFTDKDGNTTKVSEKDGTVEVESEDGKATISTGTGGDVKLPKDYPESDVPLFAPKEITTSMSGNDGDKTYFTIYYYTDKSPEEVHNFYSSKFTDLDESIVNNASESYYETGYMGKWSVLLTIYPDNSTGYKTIVTMYIESIEEQ